MTDNPNPLGGFMTSFSNGFSNARDRKAMLANREEERAQRKAERQQMQSYGGGGEGADRRTSGQRGGGAPLRTADPADTSLAPYQRAFLNSISANESAGAYNVRYTPNGGATFDMNGQHPRVYEPGTHGKSSAAGRYQFVWSTWKGIAGADTPFTPENQDRYAWQLAVQDYSKRTGRDLAADLQANGMTRDIAQALTPTWQGLGHKFDRTASTYADSLARYSAPPPAPPAAQAQPMARSLSLPPIAPENQYPIGQPK